MTSRFVPPASSAPLNVSVYLISTWTSPLWYLFSFTNLTIQTHNFDLFPQTYNLHILLISVKDNSIVQVAQTRNVDSFSFPLYIKSFRNTVSRVFKQRLMNPTAVIMAQASMISVLDPRLLRWVSNYSKWASCFHPGLCSLFSTHQPKWSTEL